MFGNLLNLAMSVIPSQSVEWLKFKERAHTDTGEPVSIYHGPVTIRGSWQAVDARTMQQLGLDMERVYRQLYTSHAIDGVNIGEGSDRIVADGYAYEVVGNADWYNQDGWRGIMAVRQEATP